MRVANIGRLLVISFFYLGVGAQADNTTCENAIYLVADASPVETTFTAADQTRWFKFHAEANRSYAQMTDHLSPGDVQETIFAFVTRVSGNCAGPDVGFTFTLSTEPRSLSVGDGANGTGRAAFKDPPAGAIFFAWQASAGTLRVRIVETTLFGPRWSTFSGFNTSWGFHNTTNSDLEVTLRVIRTTGEVLATEDFTVLPGRVVFKSALGLGIAPDRAGNAIVTHDGPAGALQADGFMVSPDGLTGFRVNFETRSPQK